MMYQYINLWFFPFYRFELHFIDRYMYFNIHKFHKKVKEAITWNRLQDYNKHRPKLPATLSGPTDHTEWDLSPWLVELKLKLMVTTAKSEVSFSINDWGGGGYKHSFHIHSKSSYTNECQANCCRFTSCWLFN